ncbi:hypothetical protein NE619_12655 [Anaerovorax odorimutans]|uniref:Uncharacterized protein n=1 Tax=Anaerovorax odorimutans TaxID=109327 RepID=A0ABT1RQW1_9FIRM|nr:hypothetical protein [Anaerovorax odorimutans]MCQ4637577.1 hypothetical protein [Anaerovorax odorimutans]
MSDKLFGRLLICLTALGCVCTAGLVIYTIYLYSNCSIISFIANGR